MVSPRESWSPADSNLLADLHMADLTAVEIAEHLPGRNPDSIRRRIRYLRAANVLPRPFSEEERDNTQQMMIADYTLASRLFGAKFEDDPRSVAAKMGRAWIPFSDVYFRSGSGSSAAMCVAASDYRRRPDGNGVWA